MNPAIYRVAGPIAIRLTNTKIISDKLSDRINEIKQQAGEDILLFGRSTRTIT